MFIIRPVNVYSRFTIVFFTLFFYDYLDRNLN